MGMQDDVRGKHGHRLIFICYIAALCYFLFFSEMFGRTEKYQEYHYNLVPFREIKRFIDNRHSLGFWAVLYNIAGNVVGFMPFGFYLPMLFKRIQGIFPVFLFSLLLSLTVETTQIVFKVGSFDVDDLFLNTLGGLAGYLVFRLVRRRGNNRERAQEPK